jgi:hypothetical protein
MGSRKRLYQNNIQKSQVIISSEPITPKYSQPPVEFSKNDQTPPQHSQKQVQIDNLQGNKVA